MFRVWSLVQDISEVLRSMGVETEAPEAGDVARNNDVMTTVLRLKNKP